MNRPSAKARNEMSVAKVVEITSESKTSFEDSLQKGIRKAAASLDNVRGAWVQEQSVVVEKDQIVAYRVNMKVTFVLK